jgi:YD repeat-containing protein
LGRFVISKKDNLGLITNITYNDWGQVLTQTDPFGVVLTNTYDNWGKTLTSKTNLSATATYAYEKLSNGDAKVTETATTEQKITYTNKFGQTYKTSTKAFKTAGSFISVESQYDAIGRKIKDSEPYFEGSGASKWNTVEYDEYSRPKKATSFTGKILETTYSGRTATVTETNATGRFKKQTVDAVGYIISTEDKGGVINFKYNAAGENTEAKYDTNVVTNTYDAWGRKTEFYDPSNGKYTYEYNDGFGKLTKETSPSTGYKQYSYNNKGQLVTQTEYLSKNGEILTNKTITYSYNAKGQITGKSGTSLGKSFNSSITYDTYGRPTASTENNTTDSKSFYKNNVIYDTYGRVTSYTKGLTSSGTTTATNIEHAYDSWSGALYQVKNKANGAVLWELQTTNARGQTLTEKLGATNITNVYDANNFLSSIQHSSTIKPNLLSISYSFNAIKNELNSRTTGGDFNITENFTYDDNNRLINWTNPEQGNYLIISMMLKAELLQNDQVGSIQYNNAQSIYRPSGMTLNANGIANYDNQGTHQYTDTKHYL